MRIVRLVSGCPPLSQLVCIESQMDFDTEKFITEVQSRPPIWNTKCLEHSDRVAKQKAWEELATVYGAGLSTEKRKQLVLNLQKKWRNIRDSFVKAHKAKRTKRGSAAKKKVPYIFYEKLLFLKDALFVNNTNLIFSSEINSEKATHHADAPQSTSRAQERSCGKKSDDLVGAEFVDLNRNLENKNVENDDDRLFFLSLVKEFKKIPDHMQIQTKLDLLKVIRDAQFSDCLNTSWEYTSPNNYFGYQIENSSRRNPYTIPMHSTDDILDSPVHVQSPLSTDSQNSQDSEQDS
ncbi:uncharacterized protein LOC101738540 [Bombyx mori]|uniref:MADF domain-containing protein n=1 Tax=Bombyx mori TaxID=7091 RepID=A0A8R1WQ20_BOMMO|nr:uncharacterized protein LOC101738540 [Bombyx mori]